MKEHYYKFLYLKDGKLVSAHKGHTWDIGKEYVTEGRIKACENGYHASEYIQDALGYVQGDVLAIVEGSGKVDKESDKVCFEKMKIIRAYKWTKADSAAYAIYCAEQVIKIYEEKYPNDSRPRDAIKAAKAYLKEPNKKNMDAAADAAYDAAYAAARAADAARAELRAKLHRKAKSMIKHLEEIK